jgi:hypothetical protein
MRAHRRSSLLIVAGLVALGVAIPGTAYAKGPSEARVSGPGLAQPLALNWNANERQLATLVDVTLFWDLGRPAAAEAPSADLGDRYVVSYTVPDEQVGGGSTLNLHVYPFATPRPLIYAPAGQEGFLVGAVPEGWRTASAALTRWFESAGVTPAAAAPDSGDSHDLAGAAPPSNGPGGTWLVIVLGVGVAAAGLLALAVRRRSAAVGLRQIAEH